MLRVMPFAFVVTVLSVGAVAQSAAQSWPARPVTLVVPYAAGGPVDTLGRIVAARMADLLGQQVVVENMGGAGGMVGASRVAKAAPDGYTVLFGGSAVLAINQTLYKRPLYNAATDFSPVALLTDSPRILITRTDLPANDFAGFARHAKAAQLRYGSAGVGSGSHICALLLEGAFGMKMIHVPYRGAGPAMQDLIAGRLDFMCEQVSTAAPQVVAGNVKGFAVLGPERVPVLAQLPAAPELGLGDMDCGAWSALVVPKGTPDAIVRRLAEVASEAVDTPAARARFAEIGVTVPAAHRRTTAYLADFVPKEIARWAGPISASGAAAD